MAHEVADSDLFRLDGRVALVTGAGRGLGRGCALTLAEAGAHIIAVSRTTDDLRQLQSDLPAGATLDPWDLDVTGSEILQRIESLERLDVLVNNAGTNTPQDFTEVEDAVLDRMLDLNVRSAFRVARSAARVMAATGGGAIINMSSQMGHVGSPRRTVYCMTKHAIEGLTRAMAVELAPQGIRVNSVAPTFVETSMTAPMLEDPEFAQFVQARIPLGYPGQIRDVAAAVRFLASPAAAHVTGDSLRVDGGWTAQ